MTSVEKIRNDGASFFSFPFKVYHLPNEGEEADRIVISVPKRIFKRAVRRNLIRRRIREAWRLNKNAFPAASSHRHYLIVYTTSEVLDYDRISESVKTVLGKIS